MKVKMKTLNIYRMFTKRIPKIKYSKNTYVATETHAPRCEDCHYYKVENGIPVCKLFKYAHVVVEPGDSLSNFFINNRFARIDSSLCGVEGKYFKAKM
jgi:hypothetical protein